MGYFSTLGVGLGYFGVGLGYLKVDFGYFGVSLGYLGVDFGYFRVGFCYLAVGLGYLGSFGLHWGWFLLLEGRFGVLGVGLNRVTWVLG